MDSHLLLTYVLGILFLIKTSYLEARRHDFRPRYSAYRRYEHDYYPRRFHRRLHDDVRDDRRHRYNEERLDFDSSNVSPRGVDEILEELQDNSDDWDPEDAPRRHRRRGHRKHDPASRSRDLPRERKSRNHPNDVQSATRSDSPFARCGIRSVPKRDYSSPRYFYKRVIGGVDAAENAWPWQVYIRCLINKVVKICSGTLISKRWIVTSAQCLPSKNPAHYIVILGEHDILKRSGKESYVKVAKVDVPPIYDPNTRVNDIALVQLAADAKISSHVNYACLADIYQEIPTNCYMTGWGFTKDKSRYKYATTLQELKLKVISRVNCDKALNTTLLNTQICGGNNDWKGGCTLDEGSPLVCYHSSKKVWQLRGIFSFSGSKCKATETRYSVFTRVSQYTPHIKQAIIKSLVKPTPKTTTSTTPGSTSSTVPPSSSTAGTTYTSGPTTVTAIKTQTYASSTASKTQSTTLIVPPIPTLPPSTKHPPIITPAPVATSSTASPSPKPQQVHLKIHLRSEGCDDQTKTDTCGRSYILVNGIDYCRHKQGHNVVVVDYRTGKVEHSVAFDTSTDLAQAQALLSFLQNLGLRKVVLVAVQGDGSKYEAIVQKELVKFGAALPGEISYRSSYCLLGFSGPEQVTWIRQSSMPRYKGPSEIIQEVPLPNPTQVVRIRARSESCSMTAGVKTCGKSYIWVDGIDFSKHVEGHNVAILDFDKGVVNGARGYKAKSITDAYALRKLLDGLAFRKIIVVVMQGDASSFHAIIRASLGKFGAASVSELTSYSTYTFIGYSGPERVNWITEKWNPKELGPTDVSVYIKKGLYVCGLQYFPPLTHTPFIVGGTKARDGAWPWMAAILDGDGKFVCGSTLVARQFVLTAAHCLDLLKSRPGPYRIAIGDNVYWSTKAHRINIAKIVPHPSYNDKTHSYDIAVMKLQKPAPVQESIRTLCLNERDQFKAGKVCYIVGWGRIVQGGAQSQTLRQAKVPLVARDVCNHARSYRGRVLPNMFCAGYANGGTDACQGDSGGPLACQNRDGYWELTGVVSWGNGCAQPHQYGVYAKVSVLAPWIKKTILYNS